MSIPTQFLTCAKAHFTYVSVGYVIDFVPAVPVSVLKLAAK